MKFIDQTDKDCVESPDSLFLAYSVEADAQPDTARLGDPGGSSKQDGFVHPGGEINDGRHDLVRNVTDARQSFACILEEDTCSLPSQYNRPGMARRSEGESKCSSHLS
jgi:hypothetical protein